MQQAPERKVIGSFETVSFPEFKNGDIVAKIDTGAYTGALHSTKIWEEETAKGKVLHFTPFGHPEIDMKATDYILSHVRSSNGKGEKRYFVKMKIKLQGETYPIVLSLANRSQMKWPVLIGRRFLRQNHFLVDVNRRAKYGSNVKDKQQP